MPVTERYQVNIYAIIVLIATVLLMIFIVIAIVYFFNLMNLKPPSQTEASFLFWTGLVLSLISLAIVIYSIVVIFTHKSYVYENDEKKPSIQQGKQIPSQEPVKISTTAVQKSDLSTSFSDVPAPAKTKQALTSQLIDIESAMDL